MSESKTPTPTPEPVTPEDEQRIRELLDMHPALLQPEAIELRRHLLDARAELDEATATRRRLERDLNLMGKRVEQGRAAAVVYVERISEVEAERDEAVATVEKALADVEAIVAERDQLRAELADLAAQNAKTESNFEEFAEVIVPERDRLAEQVKAFTTVIHSAPQCVVHEQNSDPYCDTCHVCDTIRAALNGTEADR